MEDNVHILLEGTIAELIVKLELSLYRKHIWYNQKGKPMLYVQLKKALFGTLQATLLFWKLLSSTLQEWGFKLNKYEQRAANKTSKEKCAVIWHELKISHTEKGVVDKMDHSLQTEVKY